MEAKAEWWRNRKERKEWARRLRSEDPGLDVVHPHAAGIDVGNSTHYVAVRPERDAEPVRRFECFTADLYRLADWLKSCGAWSTPPLIRARYFHKPRAIPDNLALVQFSLQHCPDCSRAPRSARVRLPDSRQEDNRR